MNKKVDNLVGDKIKEKISLLRDEVNKNNNGINSINNNLGNKRLNGTPSNNNLSEKQNIDVDLYLKIIEDLEKEVNNLVRYNIRLQEEKLVVLADQENLRKRVQEEITEVRKYRVAGIGEKLLPVLDNFARALDVKNVTPEVKNFLVGFDMIYKLIKLSFDEEGIVEMKVKVGDTFDSNKHSAVEIVQTNKVEPGTIARILQKGYMLYDRVLRHASVEVEKTN